MRHGPAWRGAGRVNIGTRTLGASAELISNAALIGVK
jgi:hypothetical protein